MPLHRLASRGGRYAAVALATAGLTHFSIAAILWVIFLLGVAKGAVTDWARVLGPSAPAVVLLAVFVVAFWLAWKGLRISWVVILGAFIVAGACFWYDVAHHRYQIRAWLIGGEYQYTYATWWWYPESRIIHDSPNKSLQPTAAAPGS